MTVVPKLSLIELLPDELTMKALSYLGDWDRRNVAAVSQRMEYGALLLKAQEMDEFIAELNSSADGKLKKTGEHLERVSRGCKRQADGTVKELKGSVIQMKQFMIDRMKKLTFKAIGRFTSSPDFRSRPQIIQNICHLSDHRKNLRPKKWRSISSKIGEEARLARLSFDFTKYGALRSAVAAAEMIPTNRRETDRTLAWICKELIARRNLPEAIKVARKISDSDQRGKLLLEISKSFLERNDFHQSLRIVLGIANTPAERDHFLVQFCANLFEQGRIEQALVVARDNIHDQSRKEDVFLGVSQAFANRGKIGEAMQLAERLSPGPLRDTAFHGIVKALLTEHRFDLAIQTANLISTDWVRNWAFREIAKTLLQNKQVDRAIQIAALISKDWEKDAAFCDMAEALLQDKQIDRAIQIGERVSNADRKADTFKDIILHLVQQGDVQKAVELTARHIHHSLPFVNNVLLGKIVEKLAHGGHFDQAFAVSEQITEEVPGQKARLVRQIQDLQNLPKQPRTA